MPKTPIFENQKPVAEVRYLEDQNQKPPKGKKTEKTPLVNNNQQHPKVLQNLVWKNQAGQEFYRVFGSWKCDNKQKCSKNWNSAYTWILLQKYKDNIPVKELDKNKDYYQQECKACTSKVNKLIKYEHLKLNKNEDEIKPHRSDLCAKCKEGAMCWDFMKYQQQVRHFSLARQVNSNFLGFGKRFFRF